jgi:hemolysin activation/secretion protein
MPGGGWSGRGARAAAAVVAVAAAVTGAARAQIPIAAPPGTPVPAMLPGAALPSVSREAVPGVPGEQQGEVTGSVAVATAVISGATVFPAARLAPFLAGLTGPDVPVASIVSARDRLLALYRSEGYVFSAVRAELVPGANGAALTIAVTEGYISEVLLEGDIGPAGTQVLRFLRPLTEERPITIASLERRLLLVQDIPGVAVRAVIRPGVGDPGALQLVAQVSRSWYDGFLNADNRGPPFSGPAQAIGVAGLNSFTSLGERTELLYYQASGNTLNFLQAGFETFLGSSGLKLRAYAGGGDSKPSLELRRLGYAGETRVFGASLSYPILRRRAYSLYGLALFDAYDNRIDTGPDGQKVPTSDDQLRMARLGLDGVALDTLLGSTMPATNSFSLRVTQGINGLGAKSAGNPIPGRLGAVNDFFKINGEVSRTQTLVAFNESSSVSLFGSVGFQWTDDILPPSEKFFLGGVRYGRGYYFGEVTGDRALAASTELQFTSVTHAMLPDASRGMGYQIYAFFDIGQSFEQLGDDFNRRISSFGGGVRWTVTDSILFAFEAARRLNRDPQAVRDPNEELKAWAGYWNLLLRF